jgi:hypothetical protein
MMQAQELGVLMRRAYRAEGGTLVRYHSAEIQIDLIEIMKGLIEEFI